MRTLYICYFGLREPLVQTQVLPYLRQLVAGGIDVSILTFEPSFSEKWSAAELEHETAQLENEGIHWFQEAYHRYPRLPASFYDLLRGAWTVAFLVRRKGIEILHARGQVPMAMALLARGFVKCLIVYDHRGFVAEEYADAGVLKEKSIAFRSLKTIERLSIKKADQVVVLTNKMRDWLVANMDARPDSIEVIPCCVDFRRYEIAAAETTPGNPGRFEVVYAGTVTGLYMIKEMAQFFLEIQRLWPEAFFRILTVQEPGPVEALLSGMGIQGSDFSVGPAKPSDVPGYLARARLGLSFRLPTFSQIAASPTKIPEYLAAGLPVVSNAGIGDVDELLQQERVGVVVESMDNPGLANAAERALALVQDPETRRRCMEVANQHFDLKNIGGFRYLKVYRRLEKQGTSPDNKLPEP